MLQFTGKTGEEFVEWVSESAFFADYCFANPKYLKGGKEKELCDLLVLFEQHAIIIQVKTAVGLRNAGAPLPKIDSWIAKKVGEAKRQLAGARRAIAQQHISIVENARRGRIHLAISDATRFFGIAVVDSPDFVMHGVEPTGADQGLPTITLNFAQFRLVCDELSTLGDFVDYLDFRRKVFGKIEFDCASELDLVAMFAQRFDLASRATESELATINGNWWCRYEVSRHKLERDSKGAQSYVIDRIADTLHTAVPRHVRPGVDAGSSAQEYVRALDVLASLRRAERLVLGRQLHEKSDLHRRSGRARYFMYQFARRPATVFVVSDEPREERGELLFGLCQLGSCCFEGQSVLGFAINSKYADRGSVDVCALAANAWEELPAARRDELKRLAPQALRPKVHEHGDQWDETYIRQLRRISRSRSNPHRVRGSKAVERLNNKRYKSRKRR